MAASGKVFATHLFCLLVCSSTHHSNITDVSVTSAPLYLGALLPMTGRIWPAGKAGLVAARMALEDINKDPRYLAGYELNLKVYDTACHDGIGLRAAADMVFEKPQKLLAIGPGCSGVAVMVAKMLPQWGIPQISWSAASWLLNDRESYPLLYRTVASASFKIVFDELFLEMGWKLIAELHEQGMGDAASHTAKVVPRYITILLETLTNNPDSVQSAMAAVKLRHARIILTSFSEDVGRKVLCEAWRQGIYGPKYVWILPYWHKPGWWKYVTEKDGCTEEQAYEVVNGALSVGPGLNNPKDDIGLGGYNNTEFYTKYRSLLLPDEPVGFRYGATMYDALWAAAMGLEGVRDHLDQRLDRCCYNDAKFSAMLSQSLDNISFVGLSNPSVHFDKNGNVPSLLVLKQYADGVLKDIGFHQSGNKIKWFMEDRDVVMEWTSKGRVKKADAIWWRNGRRPADSPVRVHLIKSVTLPVYLFFCLLSALCIFVTLMMIVFNLTQRHRKIIKLSSPNVNTFILVGCILCYTTLFFQIPGNRVPVILICKLQIAVVAIGFSSTFGGLFAKTWRIYKIFRHQGAKKVVVTDKDLFVIILILDSAAIAILVAWFALDPFHIGKMSATSPGSGDEIIVSVSRTCVPNLNRYFIPILVGFYGCMLLFGCFLAYQTKDITIATLNDSKAIGVCIYNVFVLGTVTFGILMLIGSGDPQLIYIFMSCGILVCTLTTECILFMPKVLHYKDTAHVSAVHTVAKGSVTLNRIASVKSDAAFSPNVLTVTHCPSDGLSSNAAVM